MSEHKAQGHDLGQALKPRSRSKPQGLQPKNCIDGAPTISGSLDEDCRVWAWGACKLGNRLVRDSRPSVLPDVGAHAML